jgi:protocatechuate 3,4-dioxygenase, alpha subunit
MNVPATASQTVGPFFSVGMAWLYRREIGGPGATGRRVELTGCVRDGARRPIPDAVLEFWQADAQGLYPPDAEFLGFARVPTDANGTFRLKTIRPGRVVGARGRLQAPHLSVYIFMRGLLLPLHTRMYFSDEPSNAEDPVLALVPEERRQTLIARAIGEGALEWEIQTQGEAEREIVCFAA